MGINRNIVECKCKKNLDASNTTAVLIETLWNVNSLTTDGNILSDLVLIETLWNVND